MHRNTKLLVIILAVIAALVVGVNIGKSTNSQPVALPTPTTVPAPTLLSYQSTQCGITLSYSNNLKLSESSTSSTLIVDPTDPSMLPITLICKQNIPRLALPLDKIDAYVIESISSQATVSAKLYHDSSAKDGTPIDKLIFTNPATHLDVLISGYGDTYLNIISSLKLL